MSEAAGAQEKVCSICGVDVAGRPRVKDSQGRYTCKDCVDKAKQAKLAREAPKAAGAAPVAAAAPSAESDNAFLLNMAGASASMAGVKPCPECGRALAEKTVICTSCGFNTETGKRTSIKVSKEKAPKGSSGGGGGSGLAQNPGLIAVIIVVFFGGFAALGFVDPMLGKVALGAALVFTFAIGIWAVVSAFQDSVVSGALTLICGPYALYWVFLKNEDAMLKAMYAAAILSAITVLVISFISGAGMGGLGGR